MLAPVIPGRSLALATVAGVAAIGIAYCAFMSFQSDDGDSEEGESEDGDAGAKTEAAEDEGERATAPKEFMEAAKDDDARTVTSFLAEGLPPDAISGKYDQTALCTAAAWGCVGVAQVLLDAGASVNLANAWGLTPLHLAAMNDRLELSKLLIQHGAYTKVRAGSTHGNLMPFEMAKGELQVLLGGFSNAMHRAIDSSDLDVLRRLMGEGIDLCEPDERGRTPLHAAAEAAGLLISEVDADGSERDVDQGLQALEILTQMAGDGVVQAACKTLNAQGLSALHSLVQVRRSRHLYSVYVQKQFLLCCCNEPRPDAFGTGRPLGSNSASSSVASGPERALSHGRQRVQLGQLGPPWRRRGFGSAESIGRLLRTAHGHRLRHAESRHDQAAS